MKLNLKLSVMISRGTLALASLVQSVTYIENNVVETFFQQIQANNAEMNERGNSAAKYTNVFSY